MVKILYDCDNTIGISGKDIDDGLAILYLLGNETVKLKGVTTTYGNSSVDEVFQNTKAMFKELNIENLPLFKGAKSSENRRSEAAEFLASEASNNPGEITLVATGALTNLYGAYEIDNNFFNNLKNIVLMGGITKPLIINGMNLDELNFSCDPVATYKVLNSDCNISILTGHICLQAFFGKEELNKLELKKQNRIYDYIKRNMEPWCRFVEKTFGIWGFYNWDVVAAVYATNPEIFEHRQEYIVSDEEDLCKGYLRIDNSKEAARKINIPSNIMDKEMFNKVIFDSWERLNKLI